MKTAFLSFLTGLLCLSATAQNTAWSTTGNIGIGTISPAAPMEILSTGENLRLSYDATNKTTFNVGSTGNLVITPGAGSTTNSMQIVGSLVAGTTSSSFYLPSSNAAIATTSAQFLFGSGTATYVRAGIFGSSSTAIATGRNISTFIVAGAPYTLAASAVVPWAASSTFKAPGTITFGAGSSVTNTATIYIDGASTQGTNNFALYSNSGSNYFGGNIGIGIVNPPEKLAVNGTIHAKEMKVDLVGWPDYVFHKNFKLLSLSKVGEFIQKYGHLPGLPSQAEVETNGLQLGAINKQLTQKVEELTLYLLQQSERIEKLEKALSARQNNNQNKTSIK